jgi:hypothetical protein
MVDVPSNAQRHRCLPLQVINVALTHGFVTNFANVNKAFKQGRELDQAFIPKRIIVYESWGKNSNHKENVPQDFYGSNKQSYIILQSHIEYLMQRW